MSVDNTPNRLKDSTSRSRRKFLKITGAAGLTGLSGLAGCVGSIGGGTPTIRILGWASFEDVKDKLEQQVNAKIEITGETSAEPMFTKWNSGQNAQFDITMPNNDWVPKFIEADLLAPLNENVVTNWKNVYPHYRDLAAQQAGKNGTIYGVPQRFGWDSYIYDSRAVKETEEDLSILFNHEYAGKVGMFENHRQSMAHTALYLGFQDALKGEKFSLSDSQIQQVKQTLIEQKPDVASYYSSPPQIKKLLTGGDMSLGLSYRFVSAQLQRDGNPWAKMAVPKQGALTWFEVAVVSNKSKHKKTAWEVVNAIIDPAVVGEWLAGVGIASTNEKVASSLPDDKGAIIDIKPSRVADMIAYKNVENEDKWVTAWEQVRSS